MSKNPLYFWALLRVQKVSVSRITGFSHLKKLYLLNAKAALCKGLHLKCYVHIKILKMKEGIKRETLLGSASLYTIAKDLSVTTELNFQLKEVEYNK